MSYRVVDKPTPHQWPRPIGGAGAVSWIVVHTPEGSGDAAATVRYLTSPSVPGRVGYHTLVSGDGIVYRMAPWWNWTGHAGIGTRIPGTSVRGPQVNYRTWSVSIDNRAGQRPPDAAISLAALYVAEMIVTLDLPDAGVVLGHREVSTVPGRRSDPTKVDMVDFRAMVAGHLRRMR